MSMFRLLGALVLVTPLLIGCGGGGGGGGGGAPANQIPIAAAGADQVVEPGILVTLSAAGSRDNDGSIATYRWTQTGGTAVSLAGAETISASFTAPATLGALSFRLTVTDNAGATASDDVVVNVSIPGIPVSVLGKATFDRVQHNTSSNGLDFSNPIVAPIRGAVVELLDGNGALLQSTVADANGDYRFDSVNSSSTIRVRVKAQLLKTGAPSWNFRVVDNTSSGALYSIVSANQVVGATDLTLNLHAAVGTGTTYQTVRAAAPFAILDSVYSTVQKVLTSRPSLNFVALDLNWSVNNTTASGNPAIGDIGTSFFNGSAIYILGKADNDTDEFDDHVVIHEWGHYFEHNFSRSDSIGGPHSSGDRLDPRVAFGEGFGNAWSGIVTDDPFYRDSSGTNSGVGFVINVDNNPFFESPGWASESVVQSILYDLYDGGVESGDDIELGLTPVLDILMAQQRTTDAFTTVFPFLTGLKAENPGQASLIDALIVPRNITGAGLNDFGTAETNNGGLPGVLPVYVDIAPGETKTNLCSRSSEGTYNKLGNRVFLRLTVSTPGTFNFSVAPVATNSDPDYFVYRQGVDVSNGQGASDGDNVTETWTGALQPGVYVIDLHEYKNVDDNETNQRDSCFTMSII